MSTYTTHDEEDPGTPTHRSRPSIITNASGFAESTMTYGSLMSSDGLARLSQFPPPPVGIPFTPVQVAFEAPSSPVASDRSMTPPAGPRRALPLPPVPPLNVQKISTRPLSPNHVYSPTTSVGSRRPLPNPIPSAALSSASAYPSPHDWHDGSSSIANDPYGDAALPTSLITTLLSSTAGADSTSTTSAGQSTLRRNNYEPSVVSNALTIDSTITYPPPKTFPSPLPTNHRYPPVPPLPQDLVVDISSPQALNPPSYALMSPGGRRTPETWVSERSSQVTSLAGPEGSRAMSVTPSFQSMTSATPLINNSFPVNPILEEDEGKTSGPSTPQSRWSRTRERRASTAHSTKTTKSYVSSIVGRLSLSGDRRSFKQATSSWFRGKPLPPVPPIPDHAFREIRKAEDALPLPDLANRAATLSDMLDKGHRPHHSMVSIPNTPDRNMQEGVRYGDVRYTGADPSRTHIARDRKGRSGDFTYQPWNQPQPQSPGSPSKDRKFPLMKKRKFIIGLIIGVLIICIAVGVAVGVTVGEKHASSHSCTGNLTGAACTLGKSFIRYFAPLLRVSNV